MKRKLFLGLFCLLGLSACEEPEALGCGCDGTPTADVLLADGVLSRSGDRYLITDVSPPSFTIIYEVCNETLASDFLGNQTSAEVIFSGDVTEYCDAQNYRYLINLTDLRAVE